MSRPVNYRDQMNGMTTAALLQLVTTNLSVGQSNVIHRVLDKREDARQRGADAANLALSVVGAGDIGSWIPRAGAAMARAEAAGDFELAEHAQGFREALLEYRKEQGH